MNKFKQLCLLLCCSFVFLNGFCPVVSMAYDDSDNFYVINDTDLNMQININNWDNQQSYVRTKYEKGKFHFDNPNLTNVFAMVFFPSHYPEVEFTFPYEPSVYDYYLLGTVTGYCTNNNNSTFRPSHIGVDYYDTDIGDKSPYNVSNTNIYDIDTGYYKGFGFSLKIDFASADNTGINIISMYGDKDGVGNKPANLTAEFGILAVKKDASEAQTMTQILNQLVDMENSLSSDIQGATNEIKDAIDNQYEVKENENFGVEEIVEELNEKAGALTFATDCLIDFLDLFDSNNDMSTTITFPSFTINVQGVDYEVWDEYEYDLSELDDNFNILLESVRWGTTMLVYVALISYIGKCWDTILGG